MGFFSALSMAVCSQIINRVNVKYLLTIALLFASYGCFLLSHIDPSTDQSYFIMADCLLGVGIGLFTVPLSVYALATIEKGNITEGSGLFSYGRLLGTSIGVSLLSTLISRQTQKIWNSLSGHINPFSQNLHKWLHTQNLSLQNPKAIISLQKAVAQQANMQAFIDAFHVCAIIFLLTIPFVLYMKKVNLTANSDNKNLHDMH